MRGAGAVEIASGRDLAATPASGTPTERDIAALASRLDPAIAITHLGA